jgi:cell division inhibitor SulA
MNTQEKILAALRKIADSHDLEWVQDSSYSNTGVVRLQRSDAFHTLIQFSYAFQGGSFSVCFANNVNDVHRVLEDFSYVDASNGKSIEAMLKSANTLMFNASFADAS